MAKSQTIEHRIEVRVSLGKKHPLYSLLLPYSESQTARERLLFLATFGAEQLEKTHPTNRIGARQIESSEGISSPAAASKSVGGGDTPVLDADIQQSHPTVKSQRVKTFDIGFLNS